VSSVPLQACLTLQRLYKRDYMPDVDQLSRCHTCAVESHVEHETKRLLLCVPCETTCTAACKEIFHAQARSDLNTQKTSLSKFATQDLSPAPKGTRLHPRIPVGSVLLDMSDLSLVPRVIGWNIHNETRRRVSLLLLDDLTVH